MANFFFFSTADESPPNDRVSSESKHSGSDFKNIQSLASGDNNPRPKKQLKSHELLPKSVLGNKPNPLRALMKAFPKLSAAELEHTLAMYKGDVLQAVEHIGNQQSEQNRHRRVSDSPEFRSRSLSAFNSVANSSPGPSNLSWIFPQLPNFNKPPAPGSLPPAHLPPHASNVYPPPPHVSIARAMAAAGMKLPSPAFNPFWPNTSNIASSMLSHPLLHQHLSSKTFLNDNMPHFPSNNANNP